MKKYRVLVCGTNFGKFYISALFKKNSDFQLEGIFAKGSNRSKIIADELGVNLYTKTEDIPENIDIACVVVKSTILGGQGTALAIELLKRKINVIQEHPVHSSDIAQCMKVANENGVNYHINSHFVNVKPVKIFMDYVKKTIKTERPLFIDISTSLIYSTIDIIGQIFDGLEPFEFFLPVEWTSSAISAMKTDFIPFKCIQGIISGIPVTFKLQNYYDPNNLDHNYLIMHRISIGSESGNTTLLSSHGPVVWTQGYPLSANNCFKDIDIEYNEDSYKYHEEKYKSYFQPAFVVFSESKGPSYNQVTYDYWPEAILKALSVMKNHIETRTRPQWQSENYLKKLSEVWVNIMKCFGKPEFITISEVDSKIPDPYVFYKAIRQQH